MKTAKTHSTIDYRLLGQRSDLVICSKCLRSGIVTPVPQIVSPRHTPRTLCNSCAKPSRSGLRRNIARLA